VRSRDFKGPGVQQIQGDCFLICPGQVRFDDYFLILIPDVHPVCGHHAVAPPSGRQEPAAGCCLAEYRVRFRPHLIHLTPD